MIEIILGLSIIVVACVSIHMLTIIKTLEERIDRRYGDALSQSVKLSVLKDTVDANRAELNAFENVTTQAMSGINYKQMEISKRVDNLEAKLSTVRLIPRKQKVR